MLRPRAFGLLFLFIGLLTLSAAIATGDDDELSCNCDEDEGVWSVQGVFESQKVSDFLIAVAYFSIPIELIYFVSFANVPFKWVLVQFIAFIVLCGLTHLLHCWTYYDPHSLQLMFYLTIAKVMTASVSFATAVTLLTLIPLLLKWKVRELFLRQNVLELDQEIGLMMKHKEASWHVRMLTREIRNSLDKNTILETTLVELSKTLGLENCLVWMPNGNGTEMNLTHELKVASSSVNHHRSISMDYPDVVEVKNRNGVLTLRPDSALADNKADEPVPVAAIRIPLLQVSNFIAGAHELVDTRYVILVLVLPRVGGRDWTNHESEIVEVVADQVAVALSHAEVLEESHLMKEKLRYQNRALQQARKDAMTASEARDSFQKAMSHGMRKPMHSIIGLLSILQEETGKDPDQKLIVDSMTKTSDVLSTLIDDVMEISSVKEEGRFPLEISPFELHSMIREASSLAKCLCLSKRFGFLVNVQSSLPDWVLGDERRAMQVILHMVGYLLDKYNDIGGLVNLRVFSVDNDGKSDRRAWGQSMPGEFVHVKFEIEIGNAGGGSSSDGLVPSVHSSGGWSRSSIDSKDTLSFTFCKRLVQMMQGNIWTARSPHGLPERMTLILPFHLRPPHVLIPEHHHQPSNSQFKGLHVLLVDGDDINRSVTKKQLEKLGFQVTTASSGFECLSALSHLENSFRIVVLDLHVRDMDGYDVAVRIRKFRSHQWPLIIAMAAVVEERVLERCFQVGMNGLIRKPAGLQVIGAEIRRAMDGCSRRV